VISTELSEVTFRLLTNVSRTSTLVITPCCHSTLFPTRPRNCAILFFLSKTPHLFVHPKLSKLIKPFIFFETNQAGELPIILKRGRMPRLGKTIHDLG